MSMREKIIELIALWGEDYDSADPDCLAKLADAILEALTAGNEAVGVAQEDDGDAWGEIFGDVELGDKLYKLPPDARSIIAQKDAEIAALQQKLAEYRPQGTKTL